MSKQPVFRYAIRAKFRQSENQLMRTAQRSDDGLDTRIRDRRDRFSHSHKMHLSHLAGPGAATSEQQAPFARMCNERAHFTWLQVPGRITADKTATTYPLLYLQAC